MAKRTSRPTGPTCRAEGCSQPADPDSRYCRRYHKCVRCHKKKRGKSNLCAEHSGARDTGRRTTRKKVAKKKVAKRKAAKRKTARRKVAKRRSGKKS